MNGRLSFNRPWIRPSWSSWMKPGPAPAWLLWARAQRAALRSNRAPWALEDHHFHRRIAPGRPDSALVFDGPMDGQIFLAYVRDFLRPRLKPGDIVIADNLGSHKVDGVWQAIEEAGANIRYLPPYSPDLNPIEQVFAKLKTLLRKAAKRTVDALWDHIGGLLDAFSPQECRNYLLAAGYLG